MGSRELDEVNLNYFHNNVVPPLALLCSGGRLGKGVSEKIEEFIDEHLKGRKGINRILVLEAEGQKATGDTGSRSVPKIQFVPLRDVQQTDALFQNYDVRNEEKLAKSFRLPRILRGDDANLNRATAYASLKFADEQIFEPEREVFDGIMNRKLMPELGAQFWMFRSNAPVVRDPERMSEMLERLVKAGILLPKEARQIAADIFNRTFEDISEEWTNRPLPFTLAAMQSGKMAAPAALLEAVIPVAEEPEAPLPQAQTQLAMGQPACIGRPLAALGHDSQ
jgi:capsid portal protein